MTFKEVEDARIVYHAKRRRLTIIAILVFVAIVIVFGLIFPFILLWLAAFYIIIAIIVVSTKTSKEYQLYKNNYKSYFVANSLAKIFTNINYNHKLGLKPKIVRCTMATADRYSSNDYMTATYKNINSVRKPLDEKVELEKVKNDILVITNFVDSLNLGRYFKGGK